MKPMNPVVFKGLVEELVEVYGEDIEVLHSELDKLCWELLTSLGYGDGIGIIRTDRTLWYG